MRRGGFYTGGCRRNGHTLNFFLAGRKTGAGFLFRAVVESRSEIRYRGLALRAWGGVNETRSEFRSKDLAPRAGMGVTKTVPGSATKTRRLCGLAGEFRPGDIACGGGVGDAAKESCRGGVFEGLCGGERDLCQFDLQYFGKRKAEKFSLGGFDGLKMPASLGQGDGARFETEGGRGVLGFGGNLNLHRAASAERAMGNMEDFEVQQTGFFHLIEDEGGFFGDRGEFSCENGTKLVETGQHFATEFGFRA